MMYGLEEGFTGSLGKATGWKKTGGLFTRMAMKGIRAILLYLCTYAPSDFLKPQLTLPSPDAAPALRSLDFIHHASPLVLDSWASIRAESSEVVAL